MGAIIVVGAISSYYGGIIGSELVVKDCYNFGDVSSSASTMINNAGFVVGGIKHY